MADHDPNRFDAAAAATASVARYGIVLVAGGGEELRLLLPTGVPTELVPRATLCPVPNVPAWFTGLLNLRSTLVPTFDLLHSLDLAPPPRRGGAVLVVGAGDAAFALHVDGELRLLATQAATAAADVPECLLDFSTGSAEAEGEIWLEFDFEAWRVQLFKDAVRARSVRRTSLQGVTS